MPHELREDLTPAFRYLDQNPEQSLMLLRSLRLGARPGFAVIVDEVTETRALILVERPDWRTVKAPVTRIQIDAAEIRSAIHLLSWLSASAHVQIFSYRPWLQELIRTVFEAGRIGHKVHCVANRRHFKPSHLQPAVVEITPQVPELFSQAVAMEGIRGGDRLFGIVQHGEVIACSALSRPDTDYVSVQAVYTRQTERQQGYGRAVLSAATQAGLDSGKTVSYGLPVEDVPSLHLVAGLGYTPACREWMVDGYPRR